MTAIRVHTVNCVRRMVDSLVAGAVAGLLAGGLEGVSALVWGQGSVGPGTQVLVVLACAGLLALFGTLLGPLVLPLVVLWPLRRWQEMLSRVDTPALYGAGLALPLLTALLFRLALYFGTAFQNRALASLAWTVAALAAMAAVLLLGMTTARAAGRVVQRWPRFGRRSVAISVIVLGWAALTLPGLVAGPDRASSGLFGFVGLVRKDTIDWRPVAVFALLAAVLWLGLELVVRRSAAVRMLAGAVALLVLGSGTIAAGSAQVRPVVRGQTVFARATLRALQRAGDRDRDGYSRWLGGGDCDDSNVQRHPGAREVAGNGQDEDCDGEDLSQQSPPAELPVQPPARPALPKNLSILLITVDALRWDAPGYAGYSRNITPNIDWLAGTAVVYDQAYAISTYTGFSVPPLWASRYPSEMPRTDRHEVRFERENVMLAERLAPGGFRNLGVAGHFPLRAHVSLDGRVRAVRVGAVRRRLRPAGLPHRPLPYFARHGRLVDPVPERSAESAILPLRALHRSAQGVPGAPRFLHLRETQPRSIRRRGRLHGPPHRPRAARLAGGSGQGSHGGDRVSRPRGSLRRAWPDVSWLRDLGGDCPRAAGDLGAGSGAPTRGAPGRAGGPCADDSRPRRPGSDEGARGVSLVPELAGGTLPDRSVLIDQPHNPYYDTKRAFILRSKEGTFKLHHLVSANTYRLYDLGRDPAEKQDLVAGQPELFQRMRRAYAAYVATIPDAKVIPTAERAEPAASGDCP